MSDKGERPADGFEYVVVGSGAGGGTLAARLAEEGRSVLLLEAGGDPRDPGANAGVPGADRLPDDYDVPAFHMFASENPAMGWSFFVRHYADDARQRLDEKYCVECDGRRVDGVLYPRAGTLGGCTAHNAMILMYPHNSDWDMLARLTGDASWGAAAMRRHFVKLENCRHRPVYRWLAKVGIDPTRHGWSGWLRTEQAVPRTAFFDRALLRMIAGLAPRRGRGDRLAVAAAQVVLPEPGRPERLAAGEGRRRGRALPPADDAAATGAPGARERVLDVARRHPDRLRVELDALATRVLFDGSNRAIGVEYRKGRRLYGASPRPGTDEGERREVRASREVVLAGGAFNTPQLLMLSGIGPREELSCHGIPVRVDLPGVGRNLQDRYEVGVVNRMDFDRWKVLAGAKFARDDRQHRQWRRGGNGVYASNGSVMAVVAKSAPERALPDILCFALLGHFSGYFPGYSSVFPRDLNYLTWAVNKGHTRNRAGRVTLRSPDPRDPPHVDFRYFDDERPRLARGPRLRGRRACGSRVD